MHAAHRYTNMLVGTAAGDAWGYTVEFRPYRSLPAYPVPRPAGQWVVSDDTQMLLATHEALHEIVDADDLGAAADAVIAAFQRWRVDPDNNRAPGNTCMASLAAIAAGSPWQRGALRSAGCGAVMRLAPAAFTPPEVRRGLSVLQALVTHNHPLAAVSSLLLCDALTDAVDQSGQQHLEQAIRDTGRLADELPHEWAADPYLLRVLAEVTEDPRAYLHEGAAAVDDPGRGHRPLTEVLASAAEEYRRRADDGPWRGDPCAGIGGGWDSGTATAIALLAADLAARHDAPVDALGWAVTSDGDSDSLGALTGALVGAASDQQDMWASRGLDPTFEPRYAREIAAAAQAGPALL